MNCVLFFVKSDNSRQTLTSQTFFCPKIKYPSVVAAKEELAHRVLRSIGLHYENIIDSEEEDEALDVDEENSDDAEEHPLSDAPSKPSQIFSKNWADMEEPSTCN